MPNRSSRDQVYIATVAEVGDGWLAELPGVGGSDLNDLGFEKLWEWGGGKDERTELVAHLLLMAVHRAELLGIPRDELISFVRTTAAAA